MISVIVPLLNEEAALPALLENLDALTGEHEVCFSDGGSTDNSLALLSGRRVVTGGKGRGDQCNRAARAAAGEVLLFLHCDSIVEPDALERIAAAVAQGAAWGCLTLRFDDPSPVFRAGECISNLRARWGKIVFGDQGIFMTRALFQQMGGFPQMPLMEDYALSLRLKQQGISPVQVGSRIITSARRFREGGPLRVGWQMQRLRAMYRRGVDLDTIGRAYRDVRERNG